MTNISYWIFFNIFILLMLALDLGVFHRKQHTISLRESLSWTSVWIILALIFNYIIYQWQGPDKAMEFLAGYLIEKSLSVDNIFVIILIFGYFNVPSKLQHRVLFYGILGALIMRAIFIIAGIKLLETFHPIIYIFGAILIFSGIKLFFQKEKTISPEKNPIIQIVKKFFPVTYNYESESFFTYINNKRHITPLFLTLILIETTDLIFAVDSIPAILSISTDPFIVYTSNAFAILGLRSLYFAVARLMDYFRFLHYGLGAILLFVGTKMFISEIYKMPTFLALLIILGILVVSIICSVLIKQSK